MNYLAHAYLSFEHPHLLLGNMISDFVKGKQKLGYPAGIQQGIMLHREIDSFTDAHPVTAEAKKYFRTAAGLYAGAFMDIVYDHFLALDTVQYNEEEWMQFSLRTYAALKQQTGWMPPRFAGMFPYMESQNWLFNYRYRQGIENSFRGLTHRAAYLADYKPAFHAFETHYEALRQLYAEFFPFVKSHVQAQIAQLSSPG